MLAFPLLCLLAGTLTTAIGVGGGTVLVLSLSLLFDPLTALALSSPVLLAGNLHRLGLYRRHVAWPLARRYALGAVPAALLGGAVAVAAPAALLRGAMVAMAVLAAVKVFARPRWTMPPGALLPGGAAVGFVTATSGGGGLLLAPMLLSAGLSGRAFAATGAAGQASVHTARLLGYGSGGLVGTEVLALGAAGAVLVAAGNLLGDRARRLIPDAWAPKLELGAVVGLVALALAGL